MLSCKVDTACILEHTHVAASNKISTIYEWSTPDKQEPVQMPLTGLEPKAQKRSNDDDEGPADKHSKFLSYM